MKLYMSPGACSLSPHIVLREVGLPFELERVDLASKRTASGRDFTEVNAKGYVPVLELDDGQRLTEGPAIILYLADSKPETRLAPLPGNPARYRLYEWLTFISSEIHKQYAPFVAHGTDDMKKAALPKLIARFDWVASKLPKGGYLMDEGFSVADAYLFTLLRWLPAAKLERGRWPQLDDYMRRIETRASVVAALKAEDDIRQQQKHGASTQQQASG